MQYLKSERKHFQLALLPLPQPPEWRRMINVSMQIHFFFLSFSSICRCIQYFSCGSWCFLSRTFFSMLIAFMENMKEWISILRALIPFILLLFFFFFAFIGIWLISSSMAFCNWGKKNASTQKLSIVFIFLCCSIHFHLRHFTSNISHRSFLFGFFAFHSNRASQKSQETAKFFFFPPTRKPIATVQLREGPWLNLIIDCSSRGEHWKDKKFNHSKIKQKSIQAEHSIKPYLFSNAIYINIIYLRYMRYHVNPVTPPPSSLISCTLVSYTIDQQRSVF